MPGTCEILIVDDSGIYRGETQLALRGISGAKVAAVAFDGTMALEELSKRSFDIVLLDLEMPGLDGLSVLKEMRSRKLTSKVIVFSALSESGAKITLEALSLGAIDFVLKPVLKSGQKPFEAIRESLYPKLKPFLSEGEKGGPRVVQATTAIDWGLFNPEILVIASSTGGPRALEELLPFLKGPALCPVLIAQHMPPLFTASLGESLGKKSGITCREGVDGEVVRRGMVYIAPGDFHMSVVRTSEGQNQIRLSQGPQRNNVRPCADFLFESVAEIFGRQTLGVVLTGMGHDGRDGARRIKEKRGAVLTQSAESCSVYGMPKSVDELGLSDKSGTPAELGTFINHVLCKRKAS